MLFLFFLLQEKELKEQRAKESQPFDIFSLAGVNLPSSGTAGGLNMTIRHESQPAVAPTIGSVKRPRKDRSAPSTDDVPRESPASGEQQRAEETSGFKTKLKRSSMAVRNENQDADSSFDRTEADPTVNKALGFLISPGYLSLLGSVLILACFFVYFDTVFFRPWREWKVGRDKCPQGLLEETFIALSTANLAAQALLHPQPLSLHPKTRQDSDEARMARPASQSWPET